MLVAILKLVILHQKVPDIFLTTTTNCFDPLKYNIMTIINKSQILILLLTTA